MGNNNSSNSYQAFKIYLPSFKVVNRLFLPKDHLPVLVLEQPLPLLSPCTNLSCPTCPSLLASIIQCLQAPNCPDLFLDSKLTHQLTHLLLLLLHQQVKLSWCKTFLPNN